MEGIIPEASKMCKKSPHQDYHPQIIERAWSEAENNFHRK
jgi:hypothetical protein